MSTTASTSLGGSFLGPAPERIFTPEDFSSDDQLMIQTAEHFTRTEVLPHLERIDKQEEGLMPDLIRKAGEIGFCGIDTPDAYGGLGQSKNLAARILEFLSLNGSFSVTIGITSGISQVGVALFGNEDQKKRFLPPLASGEQIGAYCLSEPNSGSDALSMTSRAEDKGDHWCLNGTKMWISNAQWAHQFLVMAKVDGAVTAFLVERDTPGVSISREEHKMGLKGSSTARVILEDAKVPKANLIWEPGKGHYIAFNALNLGRFKLASMSMGPAREAIRVAKEYASERKQFGKTLDSFELIQEKFRLMEARYFAAEAMTYRTGALIDDAFSQDPAGRSEIDFNRWAAEEYSLECSACKVFATEMQAMVVDEAVQIYGGYGFTEEYPVARIYRDSRISRIYEGTNEINRLFLADRFMKWLESDRIMDAFVGGTFVRDLGIRAIQTLRGNPLSQVQSAGLSDLLMLAYAEESARLRAQQVPETRPHLEVLTPWLDIEAIRAFERAANIRWRDHQSN